MERALETQRLRLLRVLAGLFAVVAFVSVGPFSRDVSAWVFGAVASVLSRAELAARYLVIAQARALAARVGSDVDRQRLFDCAFRDVAEGEREVSLADLRERLEVLRALLKDLPRSGLRLLRRAEKSVRRAGGGDQSLPCPDAYDPKALREWRLLVRRVERPPDKDRQRQSVRHTSPRYRAGGEGGSARVYLLTDR